MNLKESGVQFLALDIPEANTMIIGVLALIAQHEADAISARTKAALAARKAFSNSRYRVAGNRLIGV